MSKLIFNAPFNSLSFGNVSFNLLKEFVKRDDVDLSLFPISNNLDFSAYDVDDSFKENVKKLYEKRFNGINKETPCIRLWHLNGSEYKITDNNILYSFYECNSPTKVERSIVELNKKVIFSSYHAKNCFSDLGIETGFIPLGFDESFYEDDSISERIGNKIHFGLCGKWEKRKHTEKIIKAWVKKYGNNPKYLLTCLVTNPFFNEDQMKKLIINCLEGKRIWNVNFVPHLKTNNEINHYINSIDIELAGLSGAEGWNLPAFNSACLGKWPIVLNATSHKDWANKDNSILLKPSGKEEIYDGAFFQKGQEFNQGEKYCFEEDSLIEKFEEAEKRAKTKNTNGQKLREKFTYAKMADSLINSFLV